MTGNNKPMKKKNTSYYVVKNMGYKDLFIRGVSFLGDITAMLCFIYAWDIAIIFLMAGNMSFSDYHSLEIIVDILLIISILCINTMLPVFFRGQTFGKIAMSLKVISNKNKEANVFIVMIRQLIGFAIPYLLLFYFLGYIALGIFIAVNALIVIIDPKHRSWIDFILQTKVVVLKVQSEDIKKNELIQESEEVSSVKYNKYDLHVCSTFSHDGEHMVEELLKMAKDAGVEVLSICDHNSVKANNVAKKLAPLYGVTYISGISIDCMYEGVQIRLLGYGMNCNEERFMQIENENLAKEKAVSLRKIMLLEEATGLQIDVEELVGKNRFNVATSEMIANYVLNNPMFAQEPCLQEYFVGDKSNAPMKHFINDYFSEGKVAYVKLIHPNARDMMDLIHASNGKVCLAHPYRTFSKTEILFDQICQEKIDAIEVFTPYHDKEDISLLLTKVKQYKLHVSAGSEFHGEKMKPGYILGKTTNLIEADKLVKKFIDTIQSNENRTQ